MHEAYTHLAVADIAGALNNLPALPGNLAGEEQRATGTGGAADPELTTEPETGLETGDGSPVFMRTVAHKHDFSCPDVSASDRTGERPESKKRTPKP